MMARIFGSMEVTRSIKPPSYADMVSGRRQIQRGSVFRIRFRNIRNARRTEGHGTELMVTMSIVLQSDRNPHLVVHFVEIGTVGRPEAFGPKHAQIRLELFLDSVASCRSCWKTYDVHHSFCPSMVSQQSSKPLDKLPL